MKIKMTLLLFLAIIVMASCKKEPSITKGTFGYWSDMMCGDYVLTEVHWNGLAVDLNQDGRYRHYLIPELCSVNGYWEPDYTAQIEESSIILEDYGPTLEVNFKVPYPDFRKDTDGTVYLNGVATFPMSVRYEYFASIDNFKCQGRFYNFCYDESQVFLNSIEDIQIIEFGEGVVVVRFECSMFYVSAYTVDRGSLSYTFRKR